MNTPLSPEPFAPEPSVENDPMSLADAQLLDALLDDEEEPAPDELVPEAPDDAFGQVVAGKEAAGQRLDIFLASAFEALSRSRLKTLIEKGRVQEDGHMLTSAKAKVGAGKTYTILIPPPPSSEPIAENIPLTILYEDAHVLVIDKPAGLPVHPAPGHWTGTLVNAVLYHCGADLLKVGALGRPGIVHRLDMDTSGVMVVAKSAFAMTSLGHQFQSRTIDRQYMALCLGAPRKPFVLNGEISSRLARDPHNRKRMAVIAQLAQAGKLATTHYQTLARYGRAKEGLEPLASLMACKLETGRTHQVRVHMAHIGAPLVGDMVYGDNPRQRALAKILPEEAQIGRQALHAISLAFTHPETSERLSFQTQFPEDMARLQQALEGL